MRRLFAAVLVLVPFAAVSASAQKFHPVDERAPFGHYRVRLADDAGDPAVIAAELARTYGGRLEPFAAEGFRGFAIVMAPARARQLSTDPRVIDVEEQGGRAAAPVATPRAAAPRPATSAPPRPGVAATRVTAPRATTFNGDSWTSGPYVYDGAGNITDIGSDHFAYDSVGRLISGTSEGSANSQSYAYDSFGNRRSATTQGAPCVDTVTCGGTLDVDWTTNQVRDHNAVYDTAGNLTAYDPKSQGKPFTYQYDGAGMITSLTAPDGVVYEYIYTATDERLATNTNQGSWRFTVRDLDGKVVREVDAYVGSNGATWQWERDHVFRGPLALATITSSGSEQFHLDHLGTPRVVTNAAGEKIGFHAYYPFGEELDLGGREVPEERLKFTGHERDASGSGSLDYMHARFFGAPTGRFLSVDPALDVQKTAGVPQAWNRYAYVRNNPLRFTDPTGKWVDLCNGDKKCLAAADNFEKQRLQDLKSRDAEVRRAAEAWGAKGDTNNVFLNFVPKAVLEAKYGKGSQGGVQGGADANTHVGFVAGVFAQELKGKELDRTIAHEGTHVWQDMRFLNSFDAASGRYNATLNYTHHDAEVEAFNIGARVLPYSFFQPGAAGQRALSNYINAAYPNASALVFDPAKFPQ